MHPNKKAYFLVERRELQALERAWSRSSESAPSSARGAWRWVSSGVARALDDMVEREACDRFDLLLSSLLAVLARYRGRSEEFAARGLRPRRTALAADARGSRSPDGVLRAGPEVDAQAASVGGRAPQAGEISVVISSSAGDVGADAPKARQTTMPLELVFSAVKEGEQLRFRAEGTPELFDDGALARLLGHWETLLQHALAEPDRPLAELPLSGAEEQRRALDAWSAGPSTGNADDRCVHEIVEEHAERAPRALALVHGARALTYAELNRGASQLAHELEARGIGRGAVVAVLLDRSPELVVAILATLKAGAAYAPLDPSSPSERLASMLDDLDTPLILTTAELVSRLPPRGIPVLRLDTAWPDAAPSSRPGARTRRGDPTDLAYVIFTSGSTGRPKGVLVEHRSLTNLVRWHERAFGVSSRDRATLVAHPSFDASVWEIWPTLCGGARLDIPDEHTRRVPAELQRFLVDQRITRCFVPTQMAEALLELRWPPDTALRYLLTGGDRLRVRPDGATPFRLVNNYGPTEGTVVATSCVVEPWRGEPGGDAPPPPIGRPIDNVRMYVLDASGTPAPVGVPGELFLGGRGVARGYLDPTLTRARFAPDPFADAADGRMYRTGDLARFRPDGAIEFLGRIDHQVKLRGYRVELGEIEAALRRHPAVRDATAVVQEGGRSSRSGGRLVAYVEADGEIEGLRAHLARALPEYMIPSTILRLQRIPRNAAGKVDRRALPSPPWSRSDGEEPLVAPRTPTEELVARVWSQTLGLTAIGVHDDFGELGGESFLAAEVAARLRDATGIALPLRALLAATSVAAQARCIDEARAASIPARDRPHIVTSVRGPSLPLSFAEESLWLQVQLDPESVAYNESVSVSLPARVSAAILERALGELVRRHEILRTAFVWGGDGPVRTIAPATPFVLREVDLRGVAAEEREERAVEVAAAQAREPFHLGRGPLFRATLAHLDDDDHRLFWTLHHIVVDGVSLHRVLLKELAEIYGAFAAGRPSPLPALARQIADFACWQRELLTPEALADELAALRHKLAHLPSLALPTDRPRPWIGEHCGGTHRVRLDPELSDALKAFSREEGGTLACTLLSAFMALLGHYAGQRDVVVGTIDAGRDAVELEPLVGFFANPLVVRAEVDLGVTFRELVVHVREALLDAHARRRVPFDLVVEHLGAERSPNRSPLFQVVFVMEAPRPALPAGWAVRPNEVDLGTSKYDLTLHVDDGPAGALLAFEYDSALFDRPTIVRMAQHLETLLRGALAAPASPLSAIPLLSPSEARQIEALGAARAEIPVTECLHALFAARAQQSPDAVAVVSGDEVMTYGELDRRANQLANYLRRLGVQPDTLVGLALFPSTALLVGMLGILKAGGGYLPLDPSYPAARIEFMLADAGASVVVTDGSSREALSASGARLVCLDAEAARIGAESMVAPDSGVSPEHLAYVIYTSGSTGRPKGVMIEHRNVVRLFRSVERFFELSARDVWTLFHSFAFDFSVWETWGALLYGGRLVVVPHAVTRSPEMFYAMLHAEGVTMLSQTPSALHELMRVACAPGASAPRALRYVVCGGEALRFASLAPWFDRYGDAHPRFINMYGITETTVHVTLRPVTKADVEGNRRGIGRPLPDVELRLLNAHGAPVPPGVPGEIHVGGAGLARGYLNRPELTAARFVQRGAGGARLYRSGDLGRYLPDGDIEYLGRIDHQIKLRGFRIETGEIEAALAAHPDIRDAVVFLRDDVAGDPRLVAYATLRGEARPRRAAWRAFLKERLPDPMIPSALLFLPALPRTANGKLDRAALPPPSDERESLGEPFRYPEKPVEQILCALWGQLLRVGAVGVDDDFFALGGHSVLAAQMIARARETFAIEVGHSSTLLRALLQRPTVRALGEEISRLRDHDGAPFLGHETTCFADEVVLDGSICFDAPLAERASDPAAILLTGVTGFLGAFLLHELLQQTQADVYCLVRASSEAAARLRIQTTLQRYGLWDPRQSARVIAVPGDLAKPLLGLSLQRFDELARTIDVIHHNGCLVNFAYPYAALKAPNVGGTHEIIRLAARHRRKPVHYMSTTSIFVGHGFLGARSVDEETPIERPDLLYLGYLESKWVAEQLLARAQERGLPTAVYRPMEVGGDSRTGAWKTNSFICAFLRSFVDLGAVPALRIRLDLLPVDYLARAIVRISRKGIPAGERYHFSNRHYVYFDAMAERMRAMGYRIDEVPYRVWVERLVDHTSSHPRDSMVPFVPLFTEPWSDLRISRLEMYSEDRLPAFDTDRTTAALEGTGIGCPPVDAHLLDTYLTYFVQAGFLARPAPPERGSLHENPQRRVPSAVET